MIDTFATFLGRIGFEPTAEELADMLWLASHLDKPEPAPPPPEEKLRRSPDVRPELDERKKRTEEDAKKEEKQEEDKPLPPPEPVPPPPPKPVGRGLYLPSKQSVDAGSGTGGVPFRSPGTAALPGSLEISRALRPLMRRVRSRNRFELDIERTVQQIADEGNWSPVLRPKPTRWLDLALVIDHTSSMVIWRQAIAEMKRLLERQGAFRMVRSWGFTTGRDGGIQLHVDEGEYNPNPRVRPAKELIDPMGQRLILVISDCVAPCWHNGEAAEMIATWGAKGQIAILQMLPRHLWDGTGLGEAIPVHLFSIKPGTFNKYLLPQVPWEWMYEDVSDTFRVPVITTQPTSINPWANMVAGKGQAGAEGYLLPLPRKAGVSPVVGTGAAQDEPPDEMVDHFRKTASPVAIKLAGFLAASPLSLPVIRLIQRVMLPESRQTHLAEVFLSGLIYQVTPYAARAHPDDVEYEFHEGVRDHLLSTVLVSDAVNVLTHVSDFVNRRAGKALNFRAILNLNDPNTVEQTTIEAGSKPFANVALKVLRRLGGRYAKLSALMEQGAEALKPVPKEEPLPEKAQTDQRVKFLLPDPLREGEKRELAFRVLVAGDFGLANKEYPFRVYTIDKRSDVDRILKTYSPRLSMLVDNVLVINEEQSFLKVDLQINGMKDFHPDAIVDQQKFLKRLSDTRQGLLTFKSHIVSFPEYQAFLEELCSIESNVEELVNASNPSLVDEAEDSEQRIPPVSRFQRESLEVLANQLFKNLLIASKPIESIEEYTERFGDTFHWYLGNDAFLESFFVFAYQVLPEFIPGDHINGALIDRFIKDLDDVMGRQMDEILHHEDFQRLESAWLGLKYLTENTEFSSNLVNIDLLHVTKEEFMEDLEKASRQKDSELWELVYHQVYKQENTDPYTCMITSFPFTSGRDVQFLAQLSDLCAQTQLLFIGNAGPEFFGHASFKDVMEERFLEEKINDIPSYKLWHELRQFDGSRYMGLALPRFAGRLPYVPETNPTQHFTYEESWQVDDARSGERSYSQWIQASFGVASVMVRNVEKFGWNPGFTGADRGDRGRLNTPFKGAGGKLDNLPRLQPTDERMGPAYIPPVEASIGQAKDQELCDLGFIPLAHWDRTDYVCFFELPSIMRPEIIKNDYEATANNSVSARLPYTFLTSRLAHYVQSYAIMQVGRAMRASELKRTLTDFLMGYVSDTPDPSDATVLAKPLRSFTLDVAYKDDLPGILEISVKFRPHVAITGLLMTLNMVLYYEEDEDYYAA